MFIEVINLSEHSNLPKGRFLLEVDMVWGIEESLDGPTIIKTKNGYDMTVQNSYDEIRQKLEAI